MTVETVTPLSDAAALLARLDAALAAVATLTANEDKVSDIETEGAPVSPEAWADLGDEGRAAAHHAGGVLADLRPLLAEHAAIRAAWDAFALPMQDRDAVDGLARGMQCREVDALARLAHAFGARWLPGDLVESHGIEDDDPDDDHADVFLASRREGCNDDTRAAAEAHIERLTA